MSGTRKLLMYSSGLLLTPVVCGKAATQASKTMNAPNIILIEADDHHYKALGCLGNPVIKTPNIDRLAARGVAFSNMVCQTPACSPSRSSLLTGSYPHNNGCYSNHNLGIEGSQMRMTFPSALQRAGYHTALFGKMHFHIPSIRKIQDATDPRWIKACQKLGFDDVFGTFGKHMIGRSSTECNYSKYLKNKKLYQVVRNDWKNNRKGWPLNYVGPTPLNEEDAEDGFLASKAADWIKKQKKGKPFMLWLNFSNPHPPCDPPEKYAYMYDKVKLPPAVPTPDLRGLPADLAAKVKRLSAKTTPEQARKIRARYYAMITFLDSCVGKVMNAVKEAGLTGDTVIVYCADHGSLNGDHGMWSKGPMYKGSINAPLVIAGPMVTEKGRIVKRPIEMQDIAATFMAIADKGKARKENFKPEGVSLLPLLTGKGKFARDAAFAEYRDIKMVEDGNYKYVYGPNRKQQLLFDMKNDPDETHNLAGKPEYKEVEQKMKNKLLQWLAGTYLHSNSKAPRKK